MVCVMAFSLPLISDAGHLIEEHRVPGDFVLICARLTPDGSRIIATGLHGVVAVLERTSRTFDVVKMHSGLVHACAVSTDGRHFFTSGEDQCVAKWDVDSRHSCWKVALPAWISCLLVHDGIVHAGALDGDAVWAIDESDGRVCHEFEHRGDVAGLAILLPRELMLFSL